jgi:hypothetical protein
MARALLKVATMRIMPARASSSSASFPWLALCASMVAITACVADDQDGIEDDIDAVTDTKADGSSGSAAILALVNDPRITFEQLHETAGLSSRAARGIIGKRDFETIDDLTELDAIPYIGPITMGRLADFARDVIPPASATPTPIAWRIDADTTWSPSMGPLLANVFVPAGVTLTITAGTTIYVDGAGATAIAGTMIVKGVRAAPVAFIGRDAPDSPWEGITAQAGGIIRLDHATIRNAETGLAAVPGASEVILRNLTVEGFRRYAVDVYKASVDIDGLIAKASTLSIDGCGQVPCAGLKIGYGAIMTARNVVITGVNRAISGEGIVSVSHATLVDNLAPYGPVGRLQLTNSIVVGGEIAGSWGDETLDKLLLWQVQDEQYLPSGAEVLHGDPRFASTIDYHLTPGSAAIDAGSSGTGSVDHDLTGLPRLGAPDLGAYELAR